MSHAATFLAAALGCLVLGRITWRMSRLPAGRRGATLPVGGAFMVAATILAGCGAVYFIGADARVVRICGLLVGMLTALGMLRWLQSPPLVLLAAVFGCAWAAAACGVYIDQVKLPFTTRLLAMGGASDLVTVLWLVAVTWVFGTTSDVPGLSAGIGAVSAVTMGMLSRLQPQGDGDFVSVLAAALGGACAGGMIPSLRYPAWAAGRAGSLTLGFALALITVSGALKNTAFLILLLPLMLVGVPLIDYSFAAWRRSPDGSALTVTQVREPLHSALLRHGWSSVRITALYVAAEAFLCGLAVLLVLLIEVHFAIKLAVLIPVLSLGGVIFVSLAKVLARPRAGEMTGEKVDLLDIRVNALSMEQAVEQIESFIRSRKPHMVVTSDASAIVRSRSDPQLHDIINEADLVTPDGIGVIWSARFLDLPLYERVSGVDLALSLCELSRERGYAIYLLGAAPGVAEQAARRLEASYPGLRIAGTRNGFFTEEEEPELVRQIREARPEILLVALGIPRQEKWIKRHLQELQVPVCIGVGGSLDVYAGRVPRAPVWVRRLGMEWLYRTARDPRRLGRALLLPRLILMTLGQRMARAMGLRT